MISFSRHHFLLVSALLLPGACLAGIISRSPQSSRVESSQTKPLPSLEASVADGGGSGNAEMGPGVKENGANPPAAPGATVAQDAANHKVSKLPNRAQAYYHFALAHTYEEMVAAYGRSELVPKVIEEYRLAIENDPDSEYLNSALADFYASTNHIREAILQAESILTRDPKNLEARKLKGRIYLRSLGDMQSSSQSRETLKLAIEQFEQIVKIEPGTIENYLLLGRLYNLNKESLKAQNEFKAALKIDPNSEDAITSLAILYTESGEAAKAVGILNSIPNPARSAKLYAVLGATYEQQKDYRKAVSAFRQAVALDRDNLDAVRGLAQNLLNDGDTDAALEQFKALAQADPSDAVTNLRLGEIYRRLGKFDAALASLKKAESLVQDSLEIPYNVALVYELQGKYEEATQLLQQILEKTAKADGNYALSDKNNRAVFLERLGNIYREMGKPQLAIATFRKIITLGSENAPRGYQQVIDTYRELKQWRDASAAAREAAAKLPNDLTVKLAVAAQLADTGQGDLALSQVKALLKGGAGDREILIALAQIESRLRRWNEAEDYAARAEKLSSRPEEKDYVAFISGSIFERQKKYDAAEKMFRRVLARDAHNPMALNYLGYMLADRGVRLDEALGYIKRATELDPQNGSYLDSLGWAYYKLGKYDLAEENLAKAAEKISNEAAVHDHLAELYQKTGRTHLAAAHWKRALDEWARSVPADVDTADVARVQKKLESARVSLAQKAANPK